MILEGTISKIRFHSDETGWTVLVLSTDDGDITCVGTFLRAEEGESWKIEGELAFHDRYGEQVRVARAEKIVPKTEEQLERYLSSGVIPYIGKRTAKKMVRLFGDKVLEVLAEDIDAILKIKGIGRVKAKAIQDAVIAQRETREISMFLQELDIGPKLAMRIYNAFGDRTREVIETNPYQLIEEVDGIGFRTADRIAQSNGLDPASSFRCKAAVVYLLREEAAGDGNCYLTDQELSGRLESLLGFAPESLEDVMLELELSGQIHRDRENGRCYPEAIWHLENEVGVGICRLCSASSRMAPLLFDVERIERELGIRLAEAQKRAVRAASEHAVAVITGGPGTGKTTILKAILRVFDENGLSSELAAPTGRAAKRMEESTGRSARTIHRLLGFKGPGDGTLLRPDFDEENPLEADAVLIDEASMIDIYLMGALIAAIRPGTRLVFVGDVDQLPSVGPGNVLRDLIDSKRAETISLDEIYRQGKESLIVTNAHAILHGKDPVMNEPEGDFFFLSSPDARGALDLIEDLVCRRLPSHYGFDPMEDIQVLAPMKKGVCGIDNINEMLQRALNPADGKKSELELRDRILRAGDRIMQMKNDYGIAWSTAGGGTGEGVFNGDFGRILAADSEAAELLCDFEGRIVKYDRETVSEISHAYAITIHKSQGSEFPCVVIPAVPGPPMLLTRNLIYTGITRARRLVVIVGSLDALRRMIANTDVQKRNSSLAERIRHYSAFIDAMSEDE